MKKKELLQTRTFSSTSIPSGDPNVNGLNIESISVFSRKSVRAENGIVNVIREKIICSVVNNKIPEEWYIRSNKWRTFRYELFNFIYLVQPKTNIKTLECRPFSGARHRSLDFTIIINDAQSININFKFNIQKVSGAPQIIAATRPSRFLIAGHSFEDFYYTYFFDKLINKATSLGIKYEKPSRQEYLKSIHSTSPSMMLELQKVYYRGCPQSSKYVPGDLVATQFYQFSNNLSKSFIRAFVKETELDLEAFQKYLLESQGDNKIYALYKEGRFYKDCLLLDDIIPVNYVKSKTGYICFSSSRRVSTMVLR